MPQPLHLEQCASSQLGFDRGGPLTWARLELGAVGNRHRTVDSAERLEGAVVRPHQVDPGLVLGATLELDAATSVLCAAVAHIGRQNFAVQRSVRSLASVVIDRLPVRLEVEATTASRLDQRTVTQSLGAHRRRVDHRLVDEQSAKRARPLDLAHQQACATHGMTEGKQRALIQLRSDVAVDDREQIVGKALPAVLQLVVWRFRVAMASQIDAHPPKAIEGVQQGVVGATVEAGRVRHQQDGPVTTEVVDGNHHAIRRLDPRCEQWLHRHSRSQMPPTGGSSVGPARYGVTISTRAEIDMTRSMDHLTIAGQQLELSRLHNEHEGRLPVLFLHQGLGCVELWGPYPGRLAQRLKLPGFVYSRLGYGRSAPVERPRPLDFLEREAFDTLPRVVDALQLTEVAIVGHSDGASIALLFAARHPERVRWAVLEAPHVFVEPETIEGARRAVHDYRYGDLRTRLARYHRDVDGAFWGWADAWLDPRFATWNIEHHLAGVEAPLLMLQGRDDAFGTEEQLRAISARVSGPTTVHLLDDCGHEPHRQQPELCLAAVERFVSELADPQGPC